MLPYDTGTDVQTAIALAMRTRAAAPEHTVVSLFTDMPASAIEPADRELVRRFAVGEASDNLAITSLQVFQGPFEDARRARAFVLVNNFSYGEAHGSLSVALDDELISRSGFTIPGRGSRTFSVRGFSGPGLVSARLDAPDALAVDDAALAWVRAGRRLSLLLVSDPSPLTEEIGAIAKVVPELKADLVAPAEYDPAQSDAYDVTIFHRTVPAALPRAAARRGGVLFIYPPVGNELYPVVGQVHDVEVMDWNEAHESLRGLRLLPAWPLHAAYVLRPPPGAQPLLWTRDRNREFPLAFAHESRGGRAAVIGFDLEAEQLLNNDNVSLLVFFLNLLNWLAPPADASTPVLKTGTRAALEGFPAELPLQVEDPRAESTTLPPGTGEMEVRWAGAYRVRSDGTRRTYLANLFDAAESDIGRGKRERPAAAESRLAAVEGRREFAWWLYVAAASLMLLEWIAWRRWG
jgi:hypothetical protein